MLSWLEKLEKALSLTPLINLKTAVKLPFLGQGLEIDSKPRRQGFTRREAYLKVR